MGKIISSFGTMLSMKYLEELLEDDSKKGNLVFLEKDYLEKTRTLLNESYQALGREIERMEKFEQNEEEEKERDLMVAMQNVVGKGSSILRKKYSGVESVELSKKEARLISVSCLIASCMQEIEKLREKLIKELKR